MRQRVFIRAICYPVLFFLASCTLDTEYFKDYKDVNLISNLPLSISGVHSDGSYWWRTGTDPDGNPQTADDPYMNFEPVIVPGPASQEAQAKGVPADTPVYRLEIRNLIPNGDFEAPLDASWASEDAGSDGSYRMEIQSTAIVPTVDVNNERNWFTPLEEGNRALWIGTALGDRIGYNLAAAAPDTGDQYALRFRFRTYGDLNFQLNGILGKNSFIITFQEIGQAGEVLSMPVASTAPNKKQPLWFTMATDHRLLFDGSDPKPNNMVMDDLQMVNVSKNNWLSLSVPTLDDTVKTLLAGALYTFSIWIKDEAAADLTPLTLNAYPAQAFRFKLQYVDTQAVEAAKTTGVVTVKEISLEPSIIRPEGGWQEWTEVQLDLGAKGTTLNFPQNYTPRPQDPPVLRFLFTPTDTVNELWSYTCGRLLIAYPSFIFREKF